MRRLFSPSVVLAIAVALDRGWLGSLPSASVQVLVSRGLFLTAFLLAWRFRSGRIALAACALAATAEALRLPDPSDSLLFPAVALLLPLNLALVGLLKEWHVGSFTGLIRLGVFVLQGAGVLALTRETLSDEIRSPLLDLLRSSWIELSGWTLPQPALAGFLLAAALLIFSFVRRRTPIEAGLLGALTASFAAFELSQTALVLLAGGGLILVLSQIENAFTFAFEDGLTGLPARRALEQRMSQLGRRYAIAMVDIDHFKRLNDRHGHDVGDQVLRMVGSRLLRTGGGGTAYRYGGEEFAVLFPGKSAKDAEPHLEDLRRAIGEHPFAVRGPSRPKRKPKSKQASSTGGKRLKVTVSLGVADRNAKRPRPEQVMKAADRALYRSKKNGRNRLTVVG